MQRKITLMSFLITGISIVSPYIFNSCATDVDYLVRADFIFINETNYDIKYEGNGSVFNVEPNDTTIYTIEGDGPRTVNADSFESPLHSYCYPCVIKYDDVKCDTIMDNGPADINTFTSKQLSARHLEYTYRYSDENFQDAKECE